MSQTESKFSLIDAELWTIEGDTLQVTLEYYSQFNLQYNISVADSGNQPKNYYSPKDLVGFQYQTDSLQTKKYMSMPNPGDMGRMFMREIYRGKFSLYQVYDIDYSRTVLSYAPTYLLWKNEWVEPAISRDFELKALMHHFADCPELAYKIKTGVYGIAHIDTIIIIYENCELTDEYEYFYE